MRSFWTMFTQNVKMSVENIIGNRMRSFLTMLGIIIGVTAVISLVTTVSGVTDYMMSQFSSMGAGSLTINITGTALKSGLTENDLAEIGTLDNIEGISPSVSVTTNIVRDNEVYDDFAVSGRSEAYFVHNDVVDLGRALQTSDMDGSVDVCVLDQDSARNLFLGENPIGQTILIGGIQYTVVGLCGEDESLFSSMMGSLMGGGSGGTIYIPYKNALLLNGRNSITSVEVYIDDTDYADQLVDDLETVLYSTFNNEDDAYSVINMNSLLDMMNTMEGMMTGLLTGIASIALLVGGIGIMNMMLVTVTERTQEIGLRKALGAEPSVIQLQFLTESVILSLIGGLIGIVIGNIIAYAATNFIGTEFAFNTGAIALGFGFSMGVGIVFGWVPARNASRLNPIDALRSE